MLKWIREKVVVQYLKEEECEDLALVGLLVEYAAVEPRQLRPVHAAPVGADAVLELAAQDLARDLLHGGGERGGRHQRGGSGGVEQVPEEELQAAVVRQAGGEVVKGADLGGDAPGVSSSRSHKVLRE